jgi:ABC-type multidrug transport system ATPase subunit
LNGAGKTTTFSMLTGDELLTSGEIYLLGIPIHDHISLAYKSIAYCPQIECNFENLTVTDILTYYARLMGLRGSTVKGLTRKLIELVDLGTYQNMNSDTLSGGNKRKLSLAIALIGNRNLTYLDEPTTGVDPVARRKIWETLNLFKGKGKKSFILTSHSMDECEYLCNRIAIMGSGKLFCIGTYSQLRDTYAQGYKLHIRLHFDRISDLEYTNGLQEAVLTTIDSSMLKEFHLNSMIFFIKQGKGVLGQLFAQLNQLQETWKIEDYTLSETTLEEVFLSFAKKTAALPEAKAAKPNQTDKSAPISKRNASYV